MVNSRNLIGGITMTYENSNPDGFILKIVTKMIFVLFALLFSGATSPSETIGVHTELRIEVTSSPQKNVTFLVARDCTTAKPGSVSDHNIVLLNSYRQTSILQKQ